MRLAIFGASGRTGRPLVEQALAAGHDVAVLVRDPARLNVQHPRLTVHQGDALDPAPVDAVVRGADAVISVLGHASGSPKDILTRATANILDAMRRHGVRRLVVLTGAGVRDPKDPPPGLGARIMETLLRLLARDLLADAQRMVELVRQSDRDWVIVRVPVLTDGPRTGRYRSGYLRLAGPGSRISRADVAEFLLQQATDGAYRRSSPILTAA